LSREFSEPETRNPELERPLIMFMIRQASYVYGMHGVSLWLLASDVKRFQLLIVLNGISFLLAAIVFFAIDYYEGMPIWWTIADTFGCGIFGIALLWLNRRLKHDLQ